MKRLMILIMSLCFCFSSLNNVKAEEITIYSEYYLLIDRENGEVIFEQGSDELIYPASMTKMMTLLVGIENIEDYSEEVVLDYDIFAGLYEANASMAGYGLNEVVTLEDTLYGLFLPSGAEATRAIAFEVAGSESAFVDLMNEKAVELGMFNTHFENTTGLHDDEHVTTLQDMAILLEYALNNEMFYEVFSTRYYTSYSGSYHQSGLSWQSSMFKNIESIGWGELDESAIIGGKTGYTNPAGLCLASIASYDGRDYMLISAKAPINGPYHAVDALNVYDLMYNHYSKEVVVSKGQELVSLPVSYNWDVEEIVGVALDEVVMTIPNEMIDKIEVQLHVPDELDAPIQKGDILGQAQIVIDGEVLRVSDIVATNDVERSEILYFWSQSIIWIQSNFMLSVGVVAGILLIMILCFARRRRT